MMTPKQLRLLGDYIGKKWGPVRIEQLLIGSNFVTVELHGEEHTFSKIIYFSELI